MKKTFKSKDKFRDHKFEHSNWEKKTNKFACKECPCVGNNMFSHEVHMGRAHSNILDCGLCDAEFNKLEDLDLHLTTCEVYICRYCRTKETIQFSVVQKCSVAAC